MNGRRTGSREKKKLQKKKVADKDAPLAQTFNDTSIIILLGLFELDGFISYRLNTDITTYVLFYMMASTLAVSNPMTVYNPRCESLFY